MLCYILYRLDTNTNGNIQCVRSLLLKPPLRPLLLSIPHGRYHVRACAPTRAQTHYCNPMTKNLFKKLLVPFLSCMKMLMTMVSSSMHLCVEASSMESNGDVLEAIASTSRATRLHKRVVQSTPYQRVQALLGQRAPAPATRTRGRPAMGDYEALSSVRCKPHAQTACARAALARSLLCYACAN
jgi:hypothetical protein